MDNFEYKGHKFVPWTGDIDSELKKERRMDAAMNRPLEPLYAYFGGIYLTESEIKDRVDSGELDKYALYGIISDD